MAKVIEGIVVWAGDEKKYGNYAFKLKDEDGWFRSETRREEIIQPGYMVKLQVEKDKKGDYTVKKAALVEKGEPPKRESKGGYSGRGGYKADPAKEARIVMQHSQAMGLEAAKLIVEQGGIKLGAATKPDARKLQIEELIDEQTAKFHQQAFDPDSVLGKAAEIDAEFEDDDAKDEDDFGDDLDDIAWDED